MPLAGGAGVLKTYLPIVNRPGDIKYLIMIIGSSKLTGGVYQDTIEPFKSIPNVVLEFALKIFLHMHDITYVMSCVQLP